MRRKVVVSIALMLSVLAPGFVAWSALGASSADAAVYASKGAFCGANDSLDRASANVNSSAGFLAVLKICTRPIWRP